MKIANSEKEYSLELAVFLLTLRQTRSIEANDKAHIRERFLSGTLGEEEVRRLLERIPGAELRHAERSIEECERGGVQVLPYGGAGYPGALANIPDPPLILFLKGILPEDRVPIAVVGTRRPSNFGRNFARELAKRITTAGGVVVSGLAYGIDASAHEGALEAAKYDRSLHPGIAVLGSGHEQVYPRRHLDLFSNILEIGGAVLSEYAPATPPNKFHFPERNRIISGLSHAVVVVEAMTKSGALVTARIAGEQGREVFAVPGGVSSPLSWGPNQLLKEGATPLTEAEDLQTVFPEIVKKEKVNLQQHELSRDELEIVSFLRREGAASSDEISENTGISTQLVTSVLMELELQGVVGEEKGGRFTVAPAL